MSRVGKPTSDPRSPRARRIIPILVPRYGGIVVYWYLGVEVYGCIDVFGGFRDDLGYQNIDILVPWGVVKYGQSVVNSMVSWNIGILVLWCQNDRF